jgi:AraC-like DNA-binding protein
MHTVAGTGHFVSWDGGCLLIGRAHGLTPMHAHYAIQIAFGAEPGIRFRPSEQVEWTEYDAVVISSRQPHTMDASVVSYDAVLFVEPETREGRALSERYRASGITALTNDVLAGTGTALFSTWLEHGNASATAAAARAVVQQLTGGVEPAVVSDERILRAIAYINNHLGATMTLEQVAEEACLSPSRFRHLFVEQTGTALRPYVLWRRFLRAWEIVLRGESLSVAAHEAGFADAAHLSRTSNRMFGFPPSAMQVAASPERARVSVPR